MFYFLIPTLMTYNFVLVAAAVIPAIFLMIKVYKSDRLEKESGPFLRKLVVAGILSSLVALVVEWISEGILNAALTPEQLAYNLVLYLLIVPIAEEGAKYFFLKKRTWNSPEFNCQYDGVVYAVFVSLGFALWENISYVMSYGVGVAFVRALTAIPGHCCFGVLMGIFYGIAKKYDNLGDKSSSKVFRCMAFVVPAITHGLYDYIATVDEGNVYFIGFIAVVFVTCFILIQKMSKRDRVI